MGNREPDATGGPGALTPLALARARNRPVQGLSRRQLLRTSLAAGIGVWLLEVGAGTLVFVPPDIDHAIRNGGAGLLSYVSATSPPFDQPEPGSPFTFEPQQS